MDGDQPQSSSSESPAQKQARYRRERREAKIKAGGSSRLDKITQLSGRPAEPGIASLNVYESSTSGELMQIAPSTQGQHSLQGNATTPDPDEIDISHHPYASRKNANDITGQSAHAPQEADIRALLRSGAPPPGSESDRGQTQQEGDDPMMRLLQQMMGGIGGEPGAEGDGTLPPGLAAMLGGIGGGGAAGMPGAGGSGQQQGSSAASDKSGYAWRILHTLSALMLSIYLVSHASFTFSARLTLGRSTAPPPASSASGSVEMNQPTVNMFWIFATAELVLQGSRFLLDQEAGRSQGGWLQLIGGILPEPWRGWARLAGQYSGIWKTLVEDAMVVVFVMGIVGWWRGFAGPS